MRAIRLLMAAVFCGAAGDLPPRPAAEAAVRERIEARLNDPESTRFVFQPPVRSAGDGRMGVFMCGTVNARNRFGGYDGPVAFKVEFEPGTTQIISTNHDPQGSFGILKRACQNIYAGALP